MANNYYSKIGEHPLIGERIKSFRSDPYQLRRNYTDLFATCHGM